LSDADIDPRGEVLDVRPAHSPIAAPEPAGTPDRGEKPASDATPAPDRPPSELPETGARPEEPKRSGFFAPEPVAAGAPTEPSATLAEAVSGMRWPHDLAPIVADQIPAVLDRRVVFSTTSADATEVGRALADELEQLGFSVESVSETVAVARHGADAVELTLWPSARDATIAGERRFPTVDEASVVVEVRLLGPS
jgi:hypothetical protein